MTIWLEPIPEVLRDRAVKALEGRDALEFLGYAGNTHWIDLVIYNMEHLLKLGIYEEALFDAYTITRTNLARYPTDDLRFLFARADREKLRSLGDQLPHSGPFIAYRGVAGKKGMRRVRGFSWTGSMEKARWFALRFAGSLSDPAVYKVKFSSAAVLVYTNDRKESEFVLWPDSLRPVQIEKLQWAAKSA